MGILGREYNCSARKQSCYFFNSRFLATGSYSHYAAFYAVGQLNNGLQGMSLGMLIAYGTALFLACMASVFCIVAFFDICSDIVRNQPVRWNKSISFAGRKIILIIALLCAIGIVNASLYLISYIFGIACSVSSYLTFLSILPFIFSPLVIVNEMVCPRMLVQRSFHLLKVNFIEVIGLLGLYWISSILTIGSLVLVVFILVLLLQYFLNISMTHLDNRSYIFSFSALIIGALIIFISLYLYSAFALGLACVYMSHRNAELHRAH